MRFFLLFIIFFTINTSVFTQKHDYQWVFGYGNAIDLGYGLSVLDFNNNLVTIDTFGAIDHFEVSSGGSIICDKDGEIALMTSNCDIMDKHLNIIEGGNDIYPEEIDGNDHCALFGSYPLDQSSLFLPELTNDSTYYLINKNGEVVEVGTGVEVVATDMVLHTIVQKENGDYYVKNRRHLNETSIMVKGLAACKNQDGEKWWIYAIEGNGNLFYKYLIGGENSEVDTFTQEIGPDIIRNELIPKQYTFSPNEDILAFATEIGVFLYDFDNDTGMLSNFRMIETPDLDKMFGLVFSPNSRFIYISTKDDIYQIDLEEPDTSQAIVFIGNAETFDQYGWVVGASLMTLGPDCRIYVSPGSSSNAIHVIHNPNEKGVDCNFEIKAIEPPTRLLGDLPNIPMYRTNGNCDDTIEWGITTSTEEVITAKSNPIKIAPNPVNNLLTVTLPIERTYTQLEIRDGLGRIVQQITINDYQTIVELNTTNLPNGLYVIVPVNNTTQSIKFMVAH